jgi:tetratricopeptide (TPR) repeat protein
MSWLLRLVAPAVVLIVFTCWLVAQGPQPDLPTSLQQLQETLKRLQAEVKSLQDTVKRLSNQAQKNKGTPAPAAPVAVAGKPPSAMQRAIEAYNRGREFEEKKLFRTAIEAYSQTIELDARNDSAFLRRGDCYYQLAEYANAIFDFAHSLEIQPNSSRAYLGRASAYAAMGQSQQALSDVNEAILRNPGSPESYLLRGRLNQQAGDNPRAIADYSSALSLDPNSEKRGPGAAGDGGLRQRPPN